jgi:hypothetical protein
LFEYTVIRPKVDSETLLAGRPELVAALVDVAILGDASTRIPALRQHLLEALNGVPTPEPTDGQLRGVEVDPPQPGAALYSEVDGIVVGSNASMTTTLVHGVQDPVHIVPPLQGSTPVEPDPAESIRAELDDVVASRGIRRPDFRSGRRGLQLARHR